MVSALSTLLVSALLVINASGNLIAGRQTKITDQKCGQLMCISATTNGANVDYVLSSLGNSTLGWMGMGFGRFMNDSSMVIMWANAGKVILSHRKALGEVMPTVDPNPPRVATVADSLTSITGNTSSFGFTIPANGDTKPYVIFAHGPNPPNSSAIDADIVVHNEHRRIQLDLSDKSSPTPTSPSASTTPTSNAPLPSYRRMIIAHGILCVVGFLLFLPAGALVARYLRTFTPTWFLGHWLAQLALTGPTIVAGIALGIQAITQSGGAHLAGPHTKLGVSIFVLYICQIIFGAGIHWIKPQNKTRRPIQNYLHAVVGLLIIALAMYQVYNGLAVMWPENSGSRPLPNGVTIFYYVWVALVAVLYFAGLALLPRQFKQENQSKRSPSVSVSYDHDDDDGKH